MAKKKKTRTFFDIKKLRDFDFQVIECFGITLDCLEVLVPKLRKHRDDLKLKKDEDDAWLAAKYPDLYKELKEFDKLMEKHDARYGKK